MREAAPGTQPLARASVPLRAVRVVVVAGPDAGARVEASEEPITLGTAEGNALRLTDRTVSRFHAELCADPGGIRVRDLGSTNGVRAGAIALIDAVVAPGSELSLGATRLRIEDAERSRVELARPEALAGLVGETLVMRLLASRIAKVAPSAASVLVTGESGTGKELVARALHELSPRKDARLVVVDCGALAPSLVASELFGHERGSFTGARGLNRGAFERAHGGTLFIDEIGELPERVQPALLGVLTRGVVRRVGGESDVPVDVRVVAATHRDLRRDVNEGRFRLDLFHRLAVVQLSMPALRERADDVPLLVEHFVRLAGARLPEGHPLADPEHLAAWSRHGWPGNVRELRNAVEVALATGEAPELDAIALPPRGAFADVLDRAFVSARDDVASRFERAYLEQLLRRARENVAEAARLAEIDRSHLHELLRRHGLRGGP